MKTKKGHEIPEAIVESIKRAFPKEADEILAEIEFNGLKFDPYFYFNRWGMFVGVELDGHIHT